MELQEFTLDFDPKSFQKLLKETCDIITRTHSSLEKRKVFSAQSPDQVASLFEEPLPQHGVEWDQLLAKIEKDVIGNATLNVGPNFYSYVLSPGNQAGLAAEFISTYLNNNPAKWHLSASGVELEKLVIKWITQFIGYDEEAGGILVSGGSMANLTCLNVARNIKSNLNVSEQGLFGIPPMTIYVSNQVHYCIDKAVSMLGIGKDQVRKVPVDEQFKMDTHQLEEMIKSDLQKGLTPFCVVASGGTVNTGTVDPMEEIHGICKKYDLWFHVDAAYGGPAAGTQLAGEEFKGMEKADSMALDPHKWFYVPIEAGCVLVREKAHLKETFSLIPEYLMVDKLANDNRTDFMEYGMQLTRHFRSLKIWMTFKAYGAAKLRKAIEHDILKTKYLEKKLKDLKEIEIISPARLSIICFRYVPQGFQEDEEYLELLNQSLILDLEKDGRVFVTGTNINHKIALRVCIVNHRTQQRHLDYLVEVILELGQKLHQKMSLEVA